MKYTLFEKILLIILGAIVLGSLSLVVKNKLKPSEAEIKEAQLNEDRERIRKGMNDLYSKCDDLSVFENRLNCFREDIIKYRDQNKNRNNEFVLLLNNVETPLESEEFEYTLLRIKIPQGLKIRNCSANAFFFDLHQGYFYFSNESTYVSIECSLDEGKMRIIPKSKELQEESIRTLDRPAFY